MFCIRSANWLLVTRGAASSDLTQVIRYVASITITSVAASRDPRVRVERRCGHTQDAQRMGSASFSVRGTVIVDTISRPGRRRSSPERRGTCGRFGWAYRAGCWRLNRWGLTPDGSSRRFRSAMFRSLVFWGGWPRPWERGLDLERVRGAWRDRNVQINILWETVRLGTSGWDGRKRQLRNLSHRERTSESRFGLVSAAVVLDSISQVQLTLYYRFYLINCSRIL